MKSAFTDPTQVTGEHVVEVTPALAEAWLAFNTANRKITKNMNELILQMAEAIDAGQFQYNGETIKFAVDGTLLDGQCRLTAVTVAGKPIKALVVFGLPRATFTTIDRGAIRNPGQIVGLAGYKNSTRLAATASYLWRFVTNQAFSRKAPRPETTLEIIQECPELEQSLMAHRDMDKLMTRTLVAVCHYLFSRVDATKADEFFTQVATGENIHRGQATFALRDLLLRELTNKAKLDLPIIKALVIKAWNAYYNNVPVKTLRLGEAEEYPKIAGLTWKPKFLPKIKRKA